MGYAARVFRFRFALATICAAGLCALAGVASAATSGSAGCTLSHSETQLCGAATTKVTAGKAATITLATYEDLSKCNFAPPPGEPGNNGNYVAASVIVNWGDGTASAPGAASAGPSCTGTEEGNETGEPEPVTGVHSYKKAGTYTVSVSLIYQRGSGNSGTHCATATGGTVYDVLTNCIALGAPVTATVVVGAEAVKVPNLKGRTINQVRVLLSKAHLKLGRVTRHGARANHVTRQSPGSGRTTPAGTSVSVILG